MAVTPADLPAEFAGVDPVTAQMWIDAAECAIDHSKWAAAGCDPDQGVKLKAAHLLKLAGLGTGPALPADAITSESRGGKSVSRATSAAASGEHGSTTYGQALDNILKRVAGRPRRLMPPRPQPA